MDTAQLIGLLAGTLTTLAFLPQVWHVWRTRQTRGLSLTWLLSFSLGLALWLTYGLLSDDLPVILANGITLLLCFCLIVLKLTTKGSGLRQVD
jgi:MtN3 and saliva related transmembrane protein